MNSKMLQNLKFSRTAIIKSKDSIKNSKLKGRTSNKHRNKNTFSG